MNHELALSLNPTTTSCLVIGFFTGNKASDLPIQVSAHSLVAHLQTKLIEAGDSTYQTDQDGQGLLLIHCGEKSAYTAFTLNRYIQQIAKLILKQRLPSATIALPLLEKQSADSQLEHMIIEFEAQCYQFLQFKTKKNQPHGIKSIDWYLPNASETTPKTAKIIADSITYTRNLANLPANVCTPSHLAKQAQLIDADWNTITTKVFDRRAMEELGMGALLAVAQGSKEPPQLIQLKYTGGGSQAPIVLVGKGITFDSGGISLKPPAGMEEMKFDMAGAATVLGVITACANLKLPINVIGLLACAENMPSGSAIKPGDVVTSLSGQTIEITNTDAEGRLVLADALTFAKQFNPKFVIDIATLTGAVIIALGHVATGLMTQDEELATMLLKASNESQDKAWRLPLEDAYQELIDSPIADIVNSSADRVAGSVTAACFLSRFTQTFRWAHLDIAGTAWVSGKNRCATGRPVALLLQFLRNESHHAH